MLFDTHAHLDSGAFRRDLPDILARLPGQGIGLLMNPGCDLPSSQAACALARENPWIYAAVGLHPDAADQISPAVVDTLAQLVKDNPKVKAIGEIGLDYHYEDVPRAVQQRAFRMQLALAREVGLPVIVHEREAHGDAMEILEDFPDVKGVFHCYSGSLEMARELIKRGWYLGFTGVITFKNARKAVEVAQWAPLNRLLVETDCPYMAPEPYRGQRSDSTMIPRMVEKIAELRGLPVEAVAKATRENAMALYSIPAR